MKARATLLFVHGTGVRQTGYSASFEQIRENAHKSGLPVEVLGCFWGGSEGARLNLGGASIPGYLEAGGGEPSEDDSLMALWSVLYTDPWYELRVLRNMPVQGPFPFGQEPPSAALRRNMEEFAPSEQLRELLEADHLQRYFDIAVTALLRAEEFSQAVETAPPDPLEHRRAIARALIAHTLVAAEEAQDLPLNGAVRDRLVEQLTNELHGYGMGVGEFLLRPVKGLAWRMVTKKLVGDRGTLSDAAAPATGDVLRYLANGKAMRTYVQQSIADLGEGPIIVLAHSLGGIMCVDLLMQQAMPEVSALVTVGTQAPLFYEIGALPSLGPEESLPGHFPLWLNIYDRRDLLSYVGSEVFPGQVKDVEVRNGQPFPQSHSAYWSNPDVWTAVQDWMADENILP